MKTKLTYIANDGTPFDTEKECIEYEEKLTNKYIVCYKDKETTLIKMEFYSEPLAKRFVANCLHDCYEGNIVGDFKIVHRGKTVEFNSTELGEVVPTHLKINGTKLNEVFKLAVARDVKIPGYTLHGDYYLADEAISYTNWKKACEMKKPVILPNGKTVIAHTLSREELETIPREERKISENGHCWYWTSTPCGGNGACGVYGNGGFCISYIDTSNAYGGARLGFKNPFTN